MYEKISGDFHYFPLLKTTEAELKAYEFLDGDVKKGVLPVFELTKSRKTTKNPESKLERKINKLSEVIEQRPFVIDLTTETTYSNREIEEMLENGSNGYEEWIKFLKKLRDERGLKAIPTVHYHPQKLKDVKKQIDTLQSLFPYLAFRASVFEHETYEYIEKFFSFYEGHQDKIILILDGKFIPVYDEAKKTDFMNRIKKIRNSFTECSILCAFSSFPSFVGRGGYGGDSEGEFNIAEIETNGEIIKSSKNVYHSDYATIHPVRYHTRGGGWIPRIDVPLEKICFYYRYRRDDGSYARCAEETISDDRYERIKDFNVWGDEEIEYASQDRARGRSPSHWIAVRANLHMSRQYIRLSSLNKYLSLSL